MLARSFHHGLVAPEFLEPRRRKLGVPHGVLNVLVPEVALNRARVLARICQIEAGSMPEHVRMNVEFDASRLTAATTTKWIVRIVSGPPRNDVNT